MTQPIQPAINGAAVARQRRSGEAIRMLGIGATSRSEIAVGRRPPKLLTS